MRKRDRTFGLHAEDLVDDVSLALGIKVPATTIGSTIGYWTKQTGVFTRVGHGAYRLTECIDKKHVAAVKEEEDDEKVLIEFLVMLDKVGGIVKKYMELNKALAPLLQKLGTTK